MSCHPFTEYLVAVETGDVATHHAFLDNPGDWKVPDSDIDDFWTCYCRSALGFLRKSRGLKLSLAEQPVKYPPIIGNLTFRFSDIDDPDTFTPYDDSFVLSVVKCYQDIILESVELTSEKAEVICCVLEQRKYSEEDSQIVCRLQLQFPYCKLEAKSQVNVINPLVITRLARDSVLSLLWTTPVNNLEEIVDVGACLKPHLMYLSVASYTDKPLQLTKIYGYLTDDEIADGEAPVFSLEDAFIPGNHNHVHRGILSADSLDKQDVSFWTPLFLSLDYWTRHARLKKGKGPSLSMSPIQLIPSTRSQSVSLSTETDKLKAKRFLTMLSPHRAEEENFSKDIGQALYLVYEGKPEGLHVWSSWVNSKSGKSRAMDGLPMMTRAECKEYWGDLEFQKEFPLTLRTLAWYARIDSPKQYKQWHTKWIMEAMETSLSLTHVDIAEVLYRLKWLDFTCAAVNKKRWYEFKKHRWYPLDNASEVEFYLSHGFRDVYRRFNSELITKVASINSEAEKKVLETMSVQVLRLINKLGSSGSLTSIVKVAMNIFHHHDRDFVKFRDQNPDVLGMENCVIQTTNTQALIRDGKPEDYTTKSTGLRWNDSLHEDHPAVRDIDYWFRQMFPDPELNAYAWKLDASCLRARNSEKMFPCNCGEGDNSKSMKKKLSECAFGPYCMNFDTSVFTSTRRGGGPSPELARVEGARVGYIDEPEAGEPYKAGKTKKITGGDTMFARFCCQDGGDIQVFLTIFLNCNDPPEFDRLDKAVEQRLKYIPFLSTWVPREYAPTTEKEQFAQGLFPMDPFFEDKIPKMAPAYMWRLVHWYEVYRREGLKEPDLVKKYTKQYLEDHCPYKLFIKEEVEKVYITGLDGVIVRDENCKLTCKELYAEFVNWFKDCKPSDRIPDYPTAIKQFQRRFEIRPINNCWGGIRFKVAMARV